MKIHLLPRQSQARKSSKGKILLIGGVGSSKSTVFGDFLVKYRKESIHNEVAIAANTHKQLRDSTLKAITERLAMYGFFEDEHWEYQEQKGFFNFLGMKCYLRTIDNIDKAIAGLTLHKWLIDEFAFCGRPNQPAIYVYRKLLQRLRGPAAVKAILGLSSDCYPELRLYD